MTRPILLLSALALAAPRAPQQPVFSSRVEMVRVDVLVTEGGHPVRGLGATDFEVLDNGVRQQVTLVSLEETPLSVMLTVDLSSSVEGDRLAHLRTAGRALLAGLQPQDQAGLIAFNHAVSRLHDFTSVVNDVRAMLDQVKPIGGTALIDATYASVVATAPGDRRGLVVIFSDGVDTSSWLTEAQVVESVRRSEAIVYAVAVAQQREGPKFLRDVSDATGGRLIEVERTDDLSRAFVAVLDEFRQRYLLSYAPRGVDTPGWHKLEVRVRRRGADVRARAGYVR